MSALTSVFQSIYRVAGQLGVSQRATHDANVSLEQSTQFTALIYDLDLRTWPSNEQWPSEHFTEFNIETVSSNGV